ncbi:MAG: hypothetical protein ACAI44_31930, partial [Candidatus Sericytochromatia bacterium]
MFKSLTRNICLGLLAGLVLAGCSSTPAIPETPFKQSDFRLQSLSPITPPQLNLQGKLLFYSDRNTGIVPLSPGHRGLYLLETGYGTRYLTQLQQATARWSPDGEKIAAFEWRDGKYQVVIRQPGDGTELSYLLTAGNLSTADPLAGVPALSWHPQADTHQLMYLEAQKYTAFETHNLVSELRILKDDGARALVSFFNQDPKRRYLVSEPQWSPDAGAVAFILNDGSYQDLFLLRMPTVGASLSSPAVLRLSYQLTDASHPRWSPDGRKLLFQARNGLLIAAADGSSAPVVLPTSPAGAQITRTEKSSQGEWSPDGSRIAYTYSNSGSQDVCTVGLDGQAPNVLTAASAGNH